MANLTIHNLPEEVHRALRVRAARNGRSTEAEVRLIIEETVRPPERHHRGLRTTQDRTGSEGSQVA